MGVLDPREWADLPENIRTFWWEWWVQRHGLKKAELSTEKIANGTEKGNTPL